MARFCEKETTKSKMTFPCVKCGSRETGGRISAHFLDHPLPPEHERVQGWGYSFVVCHACWNAHLATKERTPPDPWARCPCGQHYEVNPAWRRWAMWLKTKLLY
jgi:hypothetical protein